MIDHTTHNIRVIKLISGEDIICDFTQITDPETKKFVAYRAVYPLVLTLREAQSPEGQEVYSVSYRRYNPFTTYEDFTLNPTSVITAMPPAEDILVNYVQKLKENNVDLSFLPNNGDDILGETTQSAVTEGPVAAGVS